MNRCWLFFLLLFISSAHTTAEEFRLDFTDIPTDGTLPGFRIGHLHGEKHAQWKLIQTEAPPPTTPTGAPTVKPVTRTVVAQVSSNPLIKGMPILLYESITLDNFTLATRFRIESGAFKQAGGIVFRAQDEENFYALVANALDGKLSFFKVVDGVSGKLIGRNRRIVTKGIWHELKVECRGNKIRCFLDGKEAISELTDNTFVKGMFGFFTIAGSVCHFVDTRVVFTRQIPLAQTLVEEFRERYSKLVDLQIFARPKGGGDFQAVGCLNPKDLYKMAGPVILDTIRKGAIHYSKTTKTVTVTLPVRDRNGDPVAAVRVTKKRFRGQTQKTAIVRAAPFAKAIQNRIRDAEDLVR